MASRITDISLRSFRSYDEARLHGLGELVVLVGPNAVGKTNVIEAVGLMTALSSFRRAPASQLIRQGADAARVEMTASSGSRLLELQLDIADARRYRLNGKAKRPADLKGLLPSVTFTPDDLALVKGPNSGRRRALDELGSQLHRNYHLIRRDYEKVVRSKNRLLKEGATGALLDSIDEMLVTCGASLVSYRAALFAKVAAETSRIYEGLSGGERLQATFEPSWLPEGSGLEGELTVEDARRALEGEVARLRPEECARHRALAGPQSDRISLAIDGHPAQLFGSQGQQRSLVLAWKLAEATAIEDMLEAKPVLLLDDVMGELDGARREALVSYLAGGSQAFITTANLDYFDEGMLDRAQVVTLPL